MKSLIRTRRRSALAVCAIACGAFALPATGWAASGGSGVSPGGSALTPSSGSGTAQTPAVQSGNVPVSTSGDGITLTTNASAILRRGLSFSGTAPSRLAGDVIEIQRSGHQTNWQWASTVTATIQSNGSFSALWRTNHIGRFAIRAVVLRPGMAPSAASSAHAASAQSSNSTPALTITVYRPSLATLYGPGFYGRKTACGTKLTKTTIGVANRTLKCGSKVAVYYNGETMIVPVIDRGPYANGADWDLTMATAKVLGIDSTARIGAVSLPQAPAQATAG
jgi:peptidoglycan lytic transglycosylase